MLKLEEIKKDAQVFGLEADEVVKVVSTELIGSDALTVFYKNSHGIPGEQMLFRADESRLDLAEKGKSWAFDASGESFKLGLEAYRIQTAHLFDPMMAVYTSNVEPLPHQISAVYEAMLPRQPLRFVLEDDPGAGKTIMAGLLIRELLMRADAKRILIVAPGALAEQWQDELFEKFATIFEMFSKEKQEQCASGNYFAEQDFLIARLDQLSRSEDYQNLLKNTDWDLIIVDEAHKLSAHYYGQKVEKTKRFELGELLGSLTRHFLLLTATPHNGKEEDYQIWLSLLDGDRFYGKFREGAHKVDVTDIMRRMVKEDLLRFDGTRLFPERFAYTANYDLSDLEAELYADVTDYVKNQMNRADKLNGKKKNTVGFALTQLQRRLASSPEAIYQSLKRRHSRLEDRLNEMKILARGHSNHRNKFAETVAYKIEKEIGSIEDYDDISDELNSEEYENLIDEVVDQSTAAETIPELEAEILILKDLEAQALIVVKSGNDRKWEELSKIIQENPEMRTASGSQRKLIIFTEHKDTLHYLSAKISDLLGNPQAVDVIHGGVNRDLRRKVQEEFRNNKDFIVLVATDAAGEGINLQNANLMVNYDLPWNPNRLEQRFGRIHRIGQTEVCHLWNIVANETREGEVFKKLFDKLEIAKKALGGRVFDVLGEAFVNISLKDLLIEAIRYGDQEDVKAKLFEKIEGAVDTDYLKEILQRNALAEKHMGLADLYAVKDEMDKAEARKLQPYFIRAFFEEAFKKLDGEMRSRELGRFEIRHVPAKIRERDRIIGETRTPVLKKYERICFEKECVRMDGKPMAELLHPGHPLMNAATDLILSENRNKLKQGSVLLDPTDDSEDPKIIFMIDHSVRESKTPTEKNPQLTISRRLQFVSIDKHGNTESAGWAPHLDLQPLDSYDQKIIEDILEEPWIKEDLENLALQHASQKLVPDHYSEIKTRREEQANKILSAVKDRLTKEINYLSDRFIKLSEDVAAGKQPKVQPELMRRRVEEITARLHAREKELEQMKNVVSSTPIVIGGALVIPQGLLSNLKGETTFSMDAEARSRVEQIAMNAVIDLEKSIGNEVKDVSAEKCGWDITSRPPSHEDESIDEDRHIEVKGRAKGQSTITVSRNEQIYGLNQKEKFILAIVIVDGEEFEGPFYVKEPFTSEPDFGVASINYELKDLLSRAQTPN